MAYSVEKLLPGGNSINFCKTSTPNPLFLLRHVSAETSENLRNGVFQHNRPFADLNFAAIYADSISAFG
jgi:hypothetical protein